MHLWLDNTGLHGAGRSIEGEARTRDDVRDLLQFATYLVFADDLQLSGFESESVAAESARHRSSLIDRGLPPACLGIRAIEPGAYAAACDEAALRAGFDFARRYAPRARDRVGLPIVDLPRGAEHDRQRLLEVARLDVDLDLAAIANAALSQRAAGATQYMLARSPTLRAHMNDLVKSTESWDDHESFQFDSYLRAELNDRLAAQAQAIYAPSIRRAELVARQNSLALDQLEPDLGQIAHDIRAGSAGVPCIAGGLVERARGDAEAVFDVAMEMRERATPFRAWLSKLAKKTEVEGIKGRVAWLRETRGLVRDLRRTTGLEDAPRLNDAIDIQLVLGLPVPQVNWGKASDWLGYIEATRRLVVLTELAHDRAALDPVLLDRLAASASRATGGAPLSWH